MAALQDLCWDFLFSHQMICKQHIILNHMFSQYESNLEPTTQRPPRQGPPEQRPPPQTETPLDRDSPRTETSPGAEDGNEREERVLLECILVRYII